LAHGVRTNADVKHGRQQPEIVPAPPIVWHRRTRATQSRNGAAGCRLPRRFREHQQWRCRGKACEGRSRSTFVRGFLGVLRSARRLAAPVVFPCASGPRWHARPVERRTTCYPAGKLAGPPSKTQPGWFTDGARGIALSSLTSRAEFVQAHRRRLLDSKRTSAGSYPHRLLFPPLGSWRLQGARSNARTNPCTHVCGVLALPSRRVPVSNHVLVPTPCLLHKYVACTLQRFPTSFV
jgi:hypothetical protein